MKEIPCPICNRSQCDFFLETYDERYKAEETKFNLVKCQYCGLIFLNPLPDKLELEKFYPKEYWLKGEGSHFSKIFTKLASWSKYRDIKKYKRKGRLLDIGCGTGEFLHFMQKQKWQCFGLDISSIACQKAKERVKNIYNKPLEESQFKSKFFDVITLNSVLHQMVAPGRELQEIERILKDDGFLFVVIPNINSRQFTFAKQLWYCIDSPRHIYFFSPKTIELFLKKYRFKIKEIKYPFVNLPLDLFHSLRLKVNQFGLGIILSPFLLVIALAMKLNPSWRSMMKIVAKKE